MTNSVTLSAIYSDNPVDYPAPGDLIEGSVDGGDTFASRFKTVVYDRRILHKTDATVTLSDTDCSSTWLYTNKGATATVEFDLPTAAAGLSLAFYVAAAQQITLDISTGDKIQEGANVSSGGGTMYADTVGSYVQITAIDDEFWIVEKVQGTWTLS